MSSLKEIKNRIQSVRSTQKITSAMKMVSSAKLRKAEKAITNFYPYEQRMTGILNRFLSSDDDLSSVFSEVRDVKRVAVVAFSSNSSLCGSFNSNVIKKLTQTLRAYSSLTTENILVYPIGKKVYQYCIKHGIPVQGNFESLTDKPDYQAASDLADKLAQMFKNREIDKVELIFYHFKNKSSQELTFEDFLPATLEKKTKGSVPPDYIIEPDKETIIRELIPKVLRLKLYTALLDSVASEHAARTIAMQIATDNADDLLQDLSLQYNKSRQQAITNELLDIIGGSFK